MKLALAFAAAFAIAFCSSAVAETLSLKDLIDTDLALSIESGDKLFNQFEYTATGNMPSAEYVSVSAFTDANGNVGITFQGGFLDRSGNGESYAFINYWVTVQNPTKKISAAHISGFPSVHGAGSGTMEVTETFSPVVGTVEIYHFSPSNAFQSDDSTGFTDPHITLHVQTTIHADAPDGGAASMSFIDQTFSQVLIPEPSSVVILITGLALLGCCVRRNRR